MVAVVGEPQIYRSHFTIQPPSLPLNSCLKDLPATSKKRKASQSSTVSPPENSTLKKLAMATNCSPISDTNITTNNNNRSRSVSMDGSEYSDSNDTMSTPPSDTDETNKKSLKNYPQSDNKRSNRMPPILIQTTSDHPWRKIAKAMYTKTQGLDQVTAKTTSIPLQIQINCPEESSFRLVQQFMTINKISFHTFALPKEQSLKIVIKGVPLDITDDELMEELLEEGFKPNFVRAFVKNDKRLPIHMVSLKRTENVKEIFETTELFYVRVKIEPYKSTGPAQCFSCQRFGHSSLQCGHPPRCVKCGANHSNKECKKPKEDTPTCCNCNGKHTANYRGCPYYTDIYKGKIDHSREARNKSILTTMPTPIPLPATHETTIASTIKSYASVTKHQAEKPEPTINASKLLQIIKDLLTTAQESEDVASKNAVITTVLRIINAIPTSHDE
ncbi:unnamed protein product [Macrosiphum euphorbiae]|uniref:Pre-C2HC domain-containing protein n=3 Tax=Macrosiphum euphorbiae TaxID=13131 RepID=A0AAV0XHR1_9HEMI|nr:unnamed protein product [Macrosiphum euphorbiae]